MAPFSTSTRAPLLKYQFRLRFVLEEGAEQNVGEAVIWNSSSRPRPGMDWRGRRGSSYMRVGGAEELLRNLDAKGGERLRHPLARAAADVSPARHAIEPCA